MDHYAIQRQDRLLLIAEKDEIYRVWANSYEDCREAFAEFANSQPEGIRGFLFGYAEYGRLMQQRLVNLACEQMRFPDET